VGIKDYPSPSIGIHRKYNLSSCFKKLSVRCPSPTIAGQRKILTVLLTVSGFSVSTTIQKYRHDTVRRRAAIKADAPESLQK
jgi:hypothetical protein